MASIQCAGGDGTNLTDFVLADANCVSDVAENDMDEYGDSSTTADFLRDTDNDDDKPSGNPFIPPWHFQLAYTVAFVAMVTVAAGGNVIVVWVVVAHKRMRTVINYFLVNLAIADALISVLNTLFNFVYMLHSNWPFGRAYCRFAQFISPCTISASVFTFMAIAIDRYMAIIYPLKPRMGAGLVLTVIVVIWIVSVVIAFPNLLYAEVHSWTFNNSETRTVCYLQWPDGDGSDSRTDFAYNVFLLFVNYIAPLAALLIAYTAIGKKLWGSQAIGERTAGQEETIRSKRRVVRMMIVIVVIFAVCWLPQHTYYVVTNLYPDIMKYRHTQHTYLIIYWVAMSNSMYNPIMYCWMNARFRSGFKYVFRWLPCITWHPNDALGIGGGCAKIVRLGVTTDGNHAVGGRPDILVSASTTAYRGGPRNVVRGGPPAIGNNGGGKAVNRCLLSTTQHTMLSDGGDNIDAECGGGGTGLLSAGGSSGGRISMQLRVVGGSSGGVGSGSVSGGYCSPLKVCEDNF